MNLQDKINRQRAAKAAKAAQLAAIHEEAAASLTGERVLEAVVTVSAPYGQHLPIFHTPDAPMSEEAAERAAERYMDRADSALLAGLATQDEYEAWTRALDAWVRRHTARA